MKRMYYIWFPDSQTYFNEETLEDSRFGTRYKNLKTANMIVKKFGLKNYVIYKCFE